MEIHSTINNGAAQKYDKRESEYERLTKQYVENGFTYKANEILHKLSEKDRKAYPYLLLLKVTKMFHLNQFQIIFLTHVLTQNRPCYQDQPEIFNLEDHQLPAQTQEAISVLYQESHAIKHSLGDELLETKKDYKLSDYEEQENLEDDLPQYTLPELKKIYLYLIVVSYAIKFYLNDPLKIKPYEEHIREILPNFFSNIFNLWARKYGNSVLNTTPRKINAYYMSLGFLEGEQQNNDEKQGQDCQYRNYNEIVEELIKATKQNEEPLGEQVKDEEVSPNINQ